VGAALTISWMSPKLIPADIAIAGRGTHARVAIAPGEVVAAFGGYMVSGDVFAVLPAQRRSLSIQVADDLYLVGPDQPDPNDMVNHSCDPNCGILGSSVLVAIRPIAAGECVVAFGGYMVRGDVFAALPARRRSLSVQVADDLYLVGAAQPEPHDMVNHSCDPNCGILGSTVLVAMRPIAAGEELSYDYAMSDGSPYDEFDCSCGTAACRGRVTGDDWSRPELITRYRGWYSA